MTALTDSDLQPLMFGIAYRMLGSVCEAEDVVQDAFLRMHQHSPEAVESPQSYAATVVTRLAIDELRTARRRREHYVGTWLPEPLVVRAGVDSDPAERVELDESLSLAMLSLLERLSPVERAVFVLREAFDYGYDDIAAVVGKSEDNCRQILTRARRRLAEGGARFEVDRSKVNELTERFYAAASAGDVAALEQLLAADVTIYGDGGGKAPALRDPASGRTRVARFVVGLMRQTLQQGLKIEPAMVNGDPGGLVLDATGAVAGTITLEIDGDEVVAIRNILNPDKLRHLQR